MTDYPDIDIPFVIKPKIAVQLGFALLFLILFLDIVSPDDYRFVLLYLFPAAIIALNAKSTKVVIAAIVLATAFENYFLFRDSYFPLYFTKIEVFNILIRLLSTLLIVWLARSLRRSQLRVNRMANTDSLTGLWNRRWARITIEQSIASLVDRGETFSVAMIDVNDFKKINDIQGHVVGDQVLTKIAHLLMGYSSEKVSCFRLGGDEFLLVAAGFDETQMKKLSDEIVSHINLEMKKANYAVSLSIGMATYESAPPSVSEVLHQVDVEMYRHKLEIKAANS
jgi:diguanylate cyclase (GGDEF)-like protein